ncbi:hypothetical protein CWB41_15955 [Methylovirgula ligni]|nr:hypothetical protein CWB41_15955 [Methylovirgula ligni]
MGEPLERPNEGKKASLAAEADETVAERGGDAREAVKALLAKIAYLEAARDRALSHVFYGYARGKLDGP